MDKKVEAELRELSNSVMNPQRLYDSMVRAYELGYAHCKQDIEGLYKALKADEAKLSRLGGSRSDGQ